jgi:hypothetical protein
MELLITMGWCTERYMGAVKDFILRSALSFRKMAHSGVEKGCGAASGQEAS